jgi:hypothetical protein
MIRILALLGATRSIRDSSCSDLGSAKTTALARMDRETERGSGNVMMCGE